MTKLKKDHPHYLNSTIIEAVIEVHFDSVLSVKDLDKIVSVYEKEYKTKKEDVLVYTASVGSNGMAVSQEKSGQVRIQIQRSDSVLVQLFSDKFSVHWLGRYLGWEHLEKEFLKTIKELKKLFPEIQSKKCGVRYINRLDEKLTDQPIKFWLKKTPHLPTNLIESSSDFFYRGKWSRAESDCLYQFMVTLAETEQVNGKFRPMLYDIDVINVHADSIKDDKRIIQVISSLHDMVWEIFSSSITINYIKFMNKKVKHASIGSAN